MNYCMYGPIFIVKMPDALLLTLVVLAFAGNFAIWPKTNARAVKDTMSIANLKKSSAILTKDDVSPVGNLAGTVLWMNPGTNVL
jgi:hypothetical protein